MATVSTVAFLFKAIKYRRIFNKKNKKIYRKINKVTGD